MCAMITLFKADVGACSHFLWAAVYSKKESMRCFHSTSILNCPAKSVWDLGLTKNYSFTLQLFLYSSINAEKDIWYLNIFFSPCLCLKTAEILYSPPHLKKKREIKIVFLILTLPFLHILVCLISCNLNAKRNICILFKWEKKFWAISLGTYRIFRLLPCWTKEEFYGCL